MAQRGVQVDLKKEKISVEQALRELKMKMEEDIQLVMDRKNYRSPSEKRREKEKERMRNIKRYQRYGRN